MIEIEQIHWIAEHFERFSDQELIRLKWAAEGLALAIKDERQSRDARAVDDACGMEKDAYEREEHADFQRRARRDDAAIEALEEKKSQ